MSLNSFSLRLLLSVYYAPGSAGVSGQQTDYCRLLKLVEKDIEGLNARNAWEVEGSGISQRKSPLRAAQAPETEASRRWKPRPAGARPPREAPSGPGSGRSQITTKGAGGRACAVAAFREGGGSGEGFAV